jgi:hypothetical protein
MHEAMIQVSVKQDQTWHLHGMNGLVFYFISALGAASVVTVMWWIAVFLHRTSF